MRRGSKSLIRLSGSNSTSSPIPAILGPLRGLGYIIVMPFVGVAVPILLSGYQASRSLITLWRKLTQETFGELEVAGAEAVSQREFLQPLVDGLECEFVVIDFDFRITQYLTPLSRKNEVLEQTAIGQHCFEVSHGRNSACESCECECPVRKVLETNDKVTVTHYHENRLEGKGKKRLVNVLALPVRDSQSNITQIAELIFNADIATPISPSVG
jgi:transcriptional regulator with PAS, ATPase and Fis domain